MKNNIKLSSLFSFRKTNKFFYYIIISFLVFVITLLSSYLLSMDSYIKKDIYNSIYYKLLDVTITDNDNINDIKENIKKYDHVVNVSNSYSYSNILYSESLKINKLSGDVELLSSTNNSLPDIVLGNNFKDDNENYIICPINFYPTDSIDEIKKLNYFDRVDLKNMLNKKIEFEYKSNNDNYTFKIEYKLIGLYKNSNNNYDENKCYVNEKSLLEIANNQYKDDYDKITKINNITLQNNLIVEIDNYKNIDYIKNILEKDGYYVEKIASISKGYFEHIYNNVKNIINCILILLIIIFIVIIKKDYNELVDNYVLLYYFGYKKIKIVVISILTNLFSTLISFIFIILITLIMFILFKILLVYIPFMFNKWNIIIDYISLFKQFIILFIIQFVVSINEVKKIKYE